LVGLLGAQVAWAAGVQWDHGASTTNWDDAANWSNNLVPDADDQLVINGFGPTSSPVISSNAPDVDELIVGFHQNPGGLTISADLKVLRQVMVGMYTNSVGNITQTAGTMETVQNLMFGYDNNAQGTYLLQGGTLKVNGELIIGRSGSGGAAGTLAQSGGTLQTFASTVTVGGGGAGTLSFADAAVATFGGQMHVGKSIGLGKVVLDGSRTGAGTNVTVGSFDLDNPDAGYFGQGTLRAVIDADAIEDPSQMRQIVVAGAANLFVGSKLELAFDDAATPTAGTWTIMTASALINHGLVLDAQAVLAGWSFNADTINDVLTVSYAPIPEPEAAGMILAVAGGLLARRHRRVA
jgi:hypothetical protein